MEPVRNNRLLLTLLLTLMFLLLYVFFMLLIQPLIEERAVQEEQIAGLNIRKGMLEKQVLEKREVESNYSQEVVQTALPVWENTEQLLLDLERIDRITGAESISVSFFAVEDVKNTLADLDPALAGVQQLKVNAIVKGTYSQIMDHVERIQNMDRVVWLDNLEVVKLLGEPNKTTPISVQIGFTAFFDPHGRDVVEQPLLPFKE